MLFFDIGANIGQWSIANLNKADKIITIEASPTTFVKLENECKKYSDKMVLLNYAVCNNDCKDVKFYNAVTDTISTMNREWLDNKNSRFYNHTKYEEIICKSITIDKLIEKYGIPDLIKIDVECGEYDCIASLTKKVNTICFEWVSETNNLTFTCIDYLYGLGYTEFYIQKGDKYNFTPEPSDYYNISVIKSKLLRMVLKVDWGMVWCK